MRTQAASAQKIGLFTLGAIAIMVTGVFVFGSKNWFAIEQKIEMVFRGSVKGLSAGSLITFRGVPIGEVQQIEIVTTNDNTEINIRVIGKLVVREKGEASSIRREMLKVLDDLVERGVAAQLVSESIVTGRLQVQLEFYRNLPRFSPPSQYGYPVIPTVPSDIEIIGKTVEKLISYIHSLDLKTVGEKMTNIVEGIDKLINSEQAQSTTRELAAAMKHLNNILQTIDEEKAGFANELLTTTQSLRQAANAATSSLTLLDQTLTQATQTLNTYERLVLPGSDISNTVIATMTALERAADQVRQLAETLQRNPEAILAGKKN